MSGDPIQLLRRIEKGDEAALAVLFADYGTAVYSLTRRVLNDETLAQEAAQDTFLKVWRNPRAWDASKGQFSSWLLTLARYTAIDRLRRERRQTYQDTDLHDEIAASDDEEDPPQIERGQMLTLLAHLPDEQRILIEMAFFKGMKHSELAEALNLPLGTVKTRGRLGLQKLRRLLEDQS